MGKFEASALFEKLGINWQGPQFGENADIFLPHKRFDDAANARMTVLIDDVYNAFITRVSEGRNLTPEQAKEVAKGRAWTGDQAIKNGLVDQIGGLNNAIDDAAIMLGHSSRHDIAVIRMPRELNSVERILELFGQEVSLGNFINANILKPFKALITQQELTKNGAFATTYDLSLIHI